MAASKGRELFEQGTDAFNRHDIDGFVALMTDDVKVTAPGAGELAGKAAARAFYQSWIDAFPDAHVEIDALHVLEDAAIEEGRFLGTHRGTLRAPSGDLPATGRRVDAEYMQVLRLRGDRIASCHLVFDRMDMLEQLGVMASTEAERAARTSGEQPGAGAQAH